MCPLSTPLSSEHLLLLHICLSCECTMVFMTKGNQSSLVNSPLRWVACFQAPVFPSRLNTMTLASLKSIVPSEREASIQLFFFLNSSYISLFETPIFDKNLKNNIPKHRVRAAIREEWGGGKHKRLLSKLSSHNVVSEEMTASLPIPPPPMGKKKK